MRVRVTFRYTADTGEVEMFQIDDLDGQPRATDHDARHDRAAYDVGRVVEANPLVARLPGNTLPPAAASTSHTADEPGTESSGPEPERHRG